MTTSTPLVSGAGRNARRGVALIEALVALAIIGFGMLAVVGSIGSLRHNGDVARQRSEALRIAQDRIEEWRGFSVLDTVPDNKRTAYEDIKGKKTDSYTVTAANTTFTVVRVVTEDAEVSGTRVPPRKHVLVSVTWTDRIEQQQEVRLSTTIAGIDPTLRVVGVAPPAGLLSRPAFGRSTSIPPGVRQISEGRSILVPPGQPSGDKVVLVFNNLSGVITRCVTAAQTTDTVDEADLTDANCGVDKYLLVQGFIRFYTAAAADAAQRATEMSLAAETPFVTPTVAVVRTQPIAGTDTCFTTTASNVVEYYCVVYTFDREEWSGSLQIGLPGFTIGAAATEYRICRFFPATRIDAGPDPDIWLLEEVNSNLLNRNLVVTTGANTVPTSGCNINNASAPRVWHHQPAN